MLDEIVIGNQNADTATGNAIMGEGGSSFSFVTILFSVYLLGVLFFLTKFFFQLIKIFLLVRKYGINRQHGVNIVFTDKSFAPFSFFNLVFISKSETTDNKREIIAHEQVHVKQRHTVDLIFMELLTLFQWFNPFVWLYKKSLKEIHEYLADDGVIEQGYNSADYQELIFNQVFGSQVFQLANNFNHSLIKRRFIMMKKMKSKKFTSLKVMLSIPLTLALVFVFACTNKDKPVANNTDKPVATIAGKTGGVITKKELLNADKIEVVSPENSNITYKVKSFVLTASVGSDLIEKSINSDNITEGMKNICRIQEQLGKVYFEDIKAEGSDGTIIDLETIKFEVENTADESGIYTVVEEPPAYPGGDEARVKYLMENIKYPKEAKKNGIQGTVLVTFVVDKDGSITDTKVFKDQGIGGGCDEEALRVINAMPKWKPGKQDGETVKVQMNIPISFKLDEKAK